mmetsp:Transcript_651/g.1281  ORF Transcript_651/g.1281 Transcript_651/m.1281 type:complete len:86 (+) Transcript_651:607-864(+)
MCPCFLHPLVWEPRASNVHWLGWREARPERHIGFFHGHSSCVSQCHGAVAVRKVEGCEFKTLIERQAEEPGGSVGLEWQQEVTGA